MTRTPVADWQQLSALYEAADALDPVALTPWLAQLRAQSHPLLAQLEQMLNAREQVQRNDFLGASPPLPAPTAAVEPRAIAWVEGSRIGPYRLVRRLGEGGMAEVWMAQRDDGAFQRTVAIKLLFRNAFSSERDTFAQRFARERDILASLNHPHIAALHDAGVTPAGQPWLALEYIEGETLTHWCDTQRLGIAQRVRLFRQVLLAVQHAHANLVIHRDLKPGNILVTAQGEVRLLDFGIAKLMEPEGGALHDTELTRAAGRPMTPRYAAPEQLLGQPLTTACDVYSLGVVLYELLCGERPYELKLDTPAQLEQSILDAEPRGPSRRALTDSAAQSRSSTQVALRKTLSSDLDAIVLRAMAKQPTKRYGSVEAFRADLDRWLAGEPVEARVPSAAYRLRKFVGRHRLGVALGTGAVLSLIGVTVVAVVMGLQAREDSARAGAARDFMLGLFKRADQEKARGADITARELLETGRKDVLTRLATQPRLQAELLQGVGTIQNDMGEYVGAAPTFAEAAKIYGELGRPHDAAMALCAQANAAMRMGNIKLAQTAIEQAKGMAKLPADDLVLRARVSEVGGWIAFVQGDYARANSLFEESYELAQKAFGPYHAKTRDALRGRVHAERLLLHHDVALKLLEQLEAAVAKTGGTDAKEEFSLAMERAVLLQGSGNYAALLAHVAAARTRCDSALGPHYADCRRLLVSKDTALLRMGMVAPAAADRPALETITEDQTSPTLAADALLLILKLDSMTGDELRRSSSFTRVQTLALSTTGAALNQNYKINALLALAEASLRASETSDAEKWIEMVLTLQRRQDGSVPPTLKGGLAKSLHGILLLEHGQAANALAVLRDAQVDLSKSLGADHSLTYLLSLNQALALEAMGRSDEALALIGRAEPVLRRSIGVESPFYARFEQLQSRLERSNSASASARRSPTQSQVRGHLEPGRVADFFF